MDSLPHVSERIIFQGSAWAQSLSRTTPFRQTGTAAGVQMDITFSKEAVRYIRSVSIGKASLVSTLEHNLARLPAYRQAGIVLRQRRSQVVLRGQPCKSLRRFRWKPRISRLPCILNSTKGSGSKVLLA